MVFGKSGNKKGDGQYGTELFDLVTRAMDKMKFSYTPNRSELRIITKFSGDDLSINVMIRTYPNRATLAFDCPLDFEVNADSRDEVSTALKEINEINSSIHYGAFTLEKGRVWFRFHYLITSPLSAEDITGMLQMTVQTVDEHDGKLAQTIKTRSASDNIDWESIYN